MAQWGTEYEISVTKIKSRLIMFLQPAYVVHIFPSCDFANESLARIAPDLLHRVAKIAHLLIVIATVWGQPVVYWIKVYLYFLPSRTCRTLRTWHEAWSVPLTKCSIVPQTMRVFPEGKRGFSSGFISVTIKRIHRWCRADVLDRRALKQRLRGCVAQRG